MKLNIGTIGYLKWIGFVGVAAMMAGCQNESPKASESASIRGDVTDIRPLATNTPVYQPAPAYQPAVQPVSGDGSYAGAATPVASGASGNTHVVKHGETLYSIARQSYGDGKQWQRIASANPGVSPTSLKVGQTLTIP